jgi:hypothetical protein
VDYINADEKKTLRDLAAIYWRLTGRNEELGKWFWKNLNACTGAKTYSQTPRDKYQVALDTAIREIRKLLFADKSQQAS